jgi:cutinase
VKTYRLLTAVVLLAASFIAPALMPTVIPSAAAAGCPPVELVFARGRLESAGPGKIGDALVSALRARANRTIGLYAVRYDADADVDRGANDMSGHIQHMMETCPDTRLVVGGYSLGAAVSDIVLAVPMSVFSFTNPLPPGADEHIAAVALFGNGSAWAGPINRFSPVYADRTIELCHGADPICNPADPNTWEANWPQHLADAYIQAGMINQAADFVMGKL